MLAELLVLGDSYPFRLCPYPQETTEDIRPPQIGRLKPAINRFAERDQAAELPEAMLKACCPAVRTFARLGLFARRSSGAIFGHPFRRGRDASTLGG